MIAKQCFILIKSVLHTNPNDLHMGENARLKIHKVLYYVKDIIKEQNLHHPTAYRSSNHQSKVEPAT